MGKKAFVLLAAAEEGNFTKCSDCWMNPYLGNGAKGHLQGSSPPLPLLHPLPCSIHSLSPWHLSHPSQDSSYLCVKHMNHQTHPFPQHCRALSLLPVLGTAGMLGGTMRCHFPTWHLPGCSRNGNRSSRQRIPAGREVLKCPDDIFCSNMLLFPVSSE